jgi:hypothetical protein
MTMNRRRRLFAATTLALVALTSISYGTVSAHDSSANSRMQHQLKIAREATSKFKSVARAEKAGYGLPPAGVPLHECISHGADGAMGLHYINGTLLDTKLDPRKPEALVYEPLKNGKLKLVALEFVVFQDAWNAKHPNRMPKLFGQMFMPVNALPNNNGLTVYNIPPFYMLHVWLFKHNPSGRFNPWNPRVTCDFAPATVAAAAPATAALAATAVAALPAADVSRFACQVPMTA